MTESEFETLAGAALAALENAFEAGAPDATCRPRAAACSRSSSRRLENDHQSSRRCARNLGRRQVGRFSLPHDGTAWRDTRDGTELFAAVSRLATQQAAHRSS